MMILEMCERRPLADALSDDGGLDSLRTGKAALDRAIQALERYSRYQRPDAEHLISKMEKSSHILLIEDTHAEARLIAEALGSLEYPHFLTRAASADEALALLADCERFSRRNPDLILLDLHMPGRDGFEVLTFLKNTSRYRAIPVVVLSESDDRDDIRHAYDLHANAFLHKYQNLEELTDALDAVCRLWLRFAGRSASEHL